MCDFVDHGDAHLPDDICLAVGDGANGPAEDGHSVGHYETAGSVPCVAFGERDTLVTTEQATVCRALLDDNDQVVDIAGELGRDLVERLGDEILETVGWNVDHAPTLATPPQTVVGVGPENLAPEITLRRDRRVVLSSMVRPPTRHAGHTAHDDSAAHRGRAGLDADDIIRELDESQRQAVTSPARPLAILAPAGSGKTRVLTRRIAWRVATEDAEAAHVLALTFTRKAAGELRTRLARLGLRASVAAGTFHSIAYAQLRSRWADRNRRAPQLIARKGPLLADVLRESDDRRGGGVSPAAVAGEIDWAKARLLGPDGYVDAVARARRRAPAPPERIAQVYAAYERRKAQHGLVDFDDLLKLCGDALLADATFAAAQRWRFRHLFVDEFQDVNPLQLRLLDAWRGAHHDLCVVGDPQQAIYGWNGADPGFLERFRERYPSADVLSLDRNYRSTPQVLSAASHVLRQARLRPAAALTTQDDGDVPRIRMFPTDIMEATGVARAVRDRRAPRTPWSAQAILVRTHGQIGLITEGLRAAGIPYKVRGASNLLDRPEVREALDFLTREARRPLASCLPDLSALDAQVSVESPDPGATPPAADLLPGHQDALQDPGNSLATLEQLARDHERIDPNATAGGFAVWFVATLQAEGADAVGDAVTVATFHASKGLEWPVVHLAGLEDGLVPVGHARTAAQRAEEARLLYVAMTRAMRGLSCTWAAVRTFKGRSVDRQICPWLRELAERAGEEPALPARLSPEFHQRLAEQRDLLAQAPQPMSATLVELVRWRDEAARAARVPAETILDDGVLEAVARAQPTDHDELLAVPGIGHILATRLGDGLLATLRGAVAD
jgi:DNA helicase II / ATP-dependent DNA helicase PcrA